MAKMTRLTNIFRWTKVRVATTANGTLASAFANASTVDGVTLATGDVILLKNQTNAVENGVYRVKSAGAPDRVNTIGNTWAVGEDVRGCAARVYEGTANANKVFAVYGEPAVVGTNGLTFLEHEKMGA